MFLNIKLLKKVLIFIGLIQFISIKSMETIKLSGKEHNKIFVVNKNMIISFSGLVRSALDADNQATEIPILGVSNKELKLLIGEPGEIGLIGQIDLINHGNLTPEGKEKLNKELDEQIDQLPDDELIELIKAANYIDSKQLLDLLIKKFAEKIVKDKKSRKESMEKLGMPTPILNIILKTVENIQNELNKQLFKWVYVNSQKGKTEVERLINNGADVNARNEDGLTPLFIASRFEGYPETISLLLQRGADVNAKNRFGETALLGAIRNMADKEHRDALIKILLDNKADVNIRNNSGQTPLYWAIIDADVYVVASLLEHGANVNEVGDEYSKDTPLMQAIAKGKMELIKLFLNTKGINVNAKNTKNGKTALDYAKYYYPGDQNLINLLKKAGAKEEIG